VLAFSDFSDSESWHIIPGWGSWGRDLEWRGMGFDEGKGHGSASGCRSEVLDDGNRDRQPSICIDDDVFTRATDAAEMTKLR
jgi:hypothetical protein